MDARRHLRSGKFVWHEQVSSDPGQAQDFYTQLFGWGTDVFKPGEVDYTMIASGGRTTAASARRWRVRRRRTGSATSVSRTSTRRSRRRRARAASVAAGPFDMGEVGRIAIIADPQGAYVSAYQPAGERPGSQGVFVWDELGDDGRGRGATLLRGRLRLDDQRHGARIRRLPDLQPRRDRCRGMMTLPDGSIPPHWQPYVAVEDVDAMVAKAGELGGSALMEPMDVPNVGRVAVLARPAGRDLRRDQASARAVAPSTGRRPSGGGRSPQGVESQP